MSACYNVFLVGQIMLIILYGILIESVQFFSVLFSDISDFLSSVCFLFREVGVEKWRKKLTT